MKIGSLKIENFRGIKKLNAQNLGDTVIICGQNGSGKSCIYDAIRLLKSTYGGYQQNEWQHFFGEFAIQLHGGMSNLKGLFNDLSKPVVFEATFELRDEERAYLIANARDVLDEYIWLALLPEAFQFGGYRRAMFSVQIRERQAEVTARVEKELDAFKAEIAAPYIIAEVKIDTTGHVFTRPSTLLSAVFSTYKPRIIGVLDFHGAQRHYGRENVQGINLSLDQSDQNQRAHSLYNYNNKYANVKSEMAGNYIKELLSEKATDNTNSAMVSLSDTLKELFETFFPDKEFLGPRPTADGTLSFPVRTQSGTEHDLDELSSGEKEILYGYLRIRSSAPRNSIILLDEPELHLNPRLIRGLPEFYRRNLGELLFNQLWLVTHSDALIREAVGKPGFDVFHMLPSGAEQSDDNQLRVLDINGDIDAALSDLVGDLAAYRPGAKGIIFEGGGDSDFDKTLVSRLFAEELRGVNLISGTNKLRVKHLHEVLERAHAKGDLQTKFYAIVDRDSDGEADNAEGRGVSKKSAVGRFMWDVYHIENYLLIPEIIADVMNSLEATTTHTQQNVLSQLKNAARQVVPSIVTQRLRAHVNSLLVECFDFGFSPEKTNIGEEIHLASKRSVDRVGRVFSEKLGADKLKELETLFRSDAELSFATGRWLIDIPGREILKRYVALTESRVGYDVLRNLIVSRMVQVGCKPTGMASIIRAIADS